MVRDEDGKYICTWTSEYAGTVKVAVGDSLSFAPSAADEGFRSKSSTGKMGGNPNTSRGAPSLSKCARCTQCKSCQHSNLPSSIEFQIRFAEGPMNPEPSPYNGHYLHSSREPHHHIPEVARGDPLVRSQTAPVTLSLPSQTRKQVEGGDKQGIQELCSGRPRNGLIGRCAFVTMISSDSYLSGALTLLYSIRRTGSKIDFVGMVTEDGISSHTLKSLEKAGMILITVGRMKKQNIQDMSEERWNDNYTKLRLWQLPFERIVFLDCDMIVLQPLDHLFALKANFAAVPDAFHPCYLNTGFMFIKPHNDTFHAMASLIDDVSSEESEQTLVNHYYLDRYHVLHYTYNFAKHNVMSPTRFQIYVEVNASLNSSRSHSFSSQRYMDTVKVIHFLGVKPWMCSRDHDCMRHVAWYGGQSNMYLYDLWWAMFEEMCELENIVCTN
eukprot:768399-Hanusia_phi.AAC.1